MLAYLILLYDPEPPSFIVLQGPEDYLHPRLLLVLAEECRATSERTQLLLTTYSPVFLDALRHEEAWMMWRDDQGYAQARRVSDVKGVPEFVEHGALLGQLWMEDHFRAGDPLAH